MRYSKFKAWRARHPRFRLHFTPTSTSRLKPVERFFVEITRKRIRRGLFHVVADPQRAIDKNLEQHNADPKHFVWAASAESIIEKISQGKRALEPQHQGEFGVLARR